MLPIVALLALVGPTTPVAPASALSAGALSALDAPCVAGPEYYAIELVTTKNIPGTGYARGVAEVTAADRSPFVVAVGSDGSYQYDIDVRVERANIRSGRLVAWLTRSDLSEVRRIGALDADLRAHGAVEWNQFLVVVTLEPDDDPTQTMWSGPVVVRGMSRSGMLHTMVGHGALQQENCSAYGFTN